MVLAELPGGVAEWLQHLGNGRVFFLEADGRAGHPDLRESRPNRVLPGNKARPAGGATLLRIVIGEQAAFIGDAIDIGGPVSHHAVTEATDIQDRKSTRLNSSH